MRVLHLVKTSDGAFWAAQQCRELVLRGVEVHAALPSLTGRALPIWKQSGATLHLLQSDWPARAPWDLLRRARGLQDLVDTVRPDLLQTCNVGPALLARWALAKIQSLPRLFWVPGPLHLENPLFRRWEIEWSGPQDKWICTSRCIREHYRRAGIEDARLFLSYAGMEVEGYATGRTGRLRESLGISPEALVVGNISYIYGPKYYLGQTIGLKCHEDLIEALGAVMRIRTDVAGVLLGGPWGGAARYARRLQRKAERVGVRMPGYLPLSDIQQIWSDIDLAVHVPLSENCGGVWEPLLCGVPVIAGDIGGLPELVIEGRTGRVVPIRKPELLADRILEALENLPRERELAQRGRSLVRRMFDVRRTAGEVFEIYRHVLEGGPRPVEFDSYEENV